jgi:hypothetical protein
MKTAVVMAFACGALLNAGCESNSDGTTGPDTGQGTFVVLLTDAPGMYDEVNIVVDSIRVHVSSGDTLAGWYTISRSPATYNLLEYMNGKDTLVAEGAVPAGVYSQMRLCIGTGSNIRKDGLSHPLEVPSGSQSGLKLNIHATISPGVRYVLVLDFDASRSIVETGNGRFMLKPVIRTVASAVSGSLTGRVAPESTDAALWAIAGEDTSTTLADAMGIFRFSYLVPATYQLTIVPGDTTYRDSTLTGIAVAAAQTTDVGTIYLQRK